MCVFSAGSEKRKINMENLQPLKEETHAGTT
jgi:hypothetical protein